MKRFIVVVAAAFAIIASIAFAQSVTTGTSAPEKKKKDNTAGLRSTGSGDESAGLLGSFGTRGSGSGTLGTPGTGSGSLGELGTSSGAKKAKTATKP